MANVAVFGAGYAGLVTGVSFAELGHRVTIRDVVPEKIEQLRAGRIPIYEPGLDELVARNRDRLSFTLDVREALDGAAFFFVCVGTPPTYAGDADLSAVWSVIDELPPESTRGILVMKSTVPVGTGEKVRATLDARGLAHVGYVSNPEFLAEGTAVENFMHPDRIVVGAFEEADAEAVEALHERLDAPVVRTDVASAEMVKLAANAYLGTRISFINEIANVCELVGADVEQVALGMGLDKRIGTHYLRAGIGFGGSCLVGEETVLVRRDGCSRLLSLERLFEELAPDEDEVLVEPEGLEVLSWREGAATPEFLPVAAATRRPYEGEIVEVRTKMGRRIRCTPDHPFVVADGEGRTRIELARDLTDEAWLPIAQLTPAEESDQPVQLDVLAGLAALGVSQNELVVHTDRRELAAMGAATVQSALATLDPIRARARAQYVVRSGSVRLNELKALAVSPAESSFSIGFERTHVPRWIAGDERFWRIVGLYIAEGSCTRNRSSRLLFWSFHPRDELDLVEEVIRFWRLLGVNVRISFGPTALHVIISSRLLATWWLDELGLGANCYSQRIPDTIWSSPDSHKRALLAGLWLGDGSWSYVAGGPSVVLEYGTVSRVLADGILRLLSDLGIVARLKIGRTKKSTCDTYWLVVSGADQVEKLLDLVPERDRERIQSSLRRQAKRIAPTGYRRHHRNAAWLRVTSLSYEKYSCFVYSLEVAQSHTFVTTSGLVVDNCFPKDISFLKLLAGNSGYHFQLLNAVIEVNELQKRRVVSKLQKHLGQLRGRRIALLGLAFKANTDDLREAPSIVLASRLLAEGAEVRAWDPVADARELLKGVTIEESVLEALAGADAAVIVTEWPELRELPWPQVRETMRNALLIDGRNLLDPNQMRAHGFAYEGVGRPTSPFGALPETEEREPELKQ